ncbi:MAG: 2-hydroxyacyl-CoA dehydratase subunit D [Candidatus Hodarchaeota archaeon]
MPIIEKPSLDKHIEKIRNLKKERVKIIGFTCSFVPEEIIHASQAFPLRLNLGGVEDIVLKGGEYMSVGTCPYARSTLGFLLDNHPLYSQCDLLITGNFCNGMESIQDYSKYLKIPAINLDVPRKTDDPSMKYFYKEISLFKNTIEKFTGSKISNDDILNSIRVYNELRMELKKINELRMRNNPPISGTESHYLIQETFLENKQEMLQKLRYIFPLLKNKKKNLNGKRVLISGSNIAFGDHIVEFIESLDGLIVGDDICSGMRYYWDNIEMNSDPIQSLTERYLTKIPCARMYPDSSRFEFIKDIYEAYSAQGIINYNLKFCDPYQLKNYPFKEYFQDKLDFPVLTVVREYAQSDLEQIRTRIEAFLERI